MTTETPAGTRPCPNCGHDRHLPGTDCDTPIQHGPNFMHRCLCLARPGAANACPPQMTCQGGTLGYADIWYLQHGQELVSAEGVISPQTLLLEPPRPAAPVVDTLPEWLEHRYGTRFAVTSSPEGDRSYWEHEAAAVRRAVARGGVKASSAAPAICEIPHVTVDEEDACERARLGVANAARAVFRRLRAHLAGFQDVLDDSDRGPWANTVGADLDELGALLDANPTAEETRNA